MRLSPIVLACLTLASTTAGGCARPAAVDEGRVARERSPIIAGTPDADHDAVVLVESKLGYTCTGTIVEKQGDLAWVLTAAHCVIGDPPAKVIEGDDFEAQGTREYPVLASAIDPNYFSLTGRDHDFAMIKIGGADAATPVIPALTPAEDAMQIGSAITNYGFGVTEADQENSKRFKVANVLSAVDALTARYEQDQGGTCFGDSGGPGVLLVNGAERVAVVTSYGDLDCLVYGVAGRVSAVYASFIRPFIDGAPIDEAGCGACLEGATAPKATCGAETDACYQEWACLDLADCLIECDAQPCVDACEAKHAKGVAEYAAVFDCACAVPCAAACAGDARCAASPTTTSASSTSASSSAETTAVSSSSSTSTSTTASSTTATSSSAGVGGAGSSGGDEGGADEPKGGEASSEGCGCVVVGGNTRGASSSWALALLGLVGVAARRRR